MNHDAFCPGDHNEKCTPQTCNNWGRGDCQCELIAKVRKDERRNTRAAAVEALWDMKIGDDE